MPYSIHILLTLHRFTSSEYLTALEVFLKVWERFVGISEMYIKPQK